MLNILKRVCNKFKKILTYRKVKEILAKNEELKNIGRGKTCFIIGNGPSINGQDLTKLADKDTFIMNNFWRHPQYNFIRPKYYVAITVPSFLDPLKPKQAHDDDLFGADPVIAQTPETKLFFSVLIKEKVEKANIFKTNPKYYILQEGFLNEQLRFNLDITKPVPFSKNTTLMAMMLAVYMGYETIYLLGCEHNWLDQPSIQTWVKNFKHFYDEPENPLPDVYRGMTYEDMIKNTLRLFQNYRFFKAKLAKSYPNVRIYNTTPRSFLDVFPFVKFEDVEL